MTTKTDIRDSIVGLRVLAQGVSQNITGVDLTPEQLQSLNFHIQECRAHLRVALHDIQAASLGARITK